MSKRILFPSAIDYLRLINDNAVDNALGRRSSFLLLPSLYQRAYAIVRETGEVPVTENVLAPNEATSRERKTRVNIITSSR